jgi:hypothetical protein
MAPPRGDGGAFKKARENLDNFATLSAATCSQLWVSVSSINWGMAMSEYSIVALVMVIVIALPTVVCGIISIFKQKIYVGSDGKPIMSELNIPRLGKLKTYTAAGILAALGACVVFLAYLVEVKGIENSTPKLVTFKGEVVIDGQSEIQSIAVGLTSGSWFQTATPNTGELTIPVQITVPNSWPSYAAYAFAPGSGKVRPKMIGTSLEDPKFSLRIGP